jgi:hypothetical protein
MLNMLSSYSLRLLEMASRHDGKWEVKYAIKDSWQGKPQIWELGQGLPVFAMKQYHIWDSQQEVVL